MDIASVHHPLLPLVIHEVTPVDRRIPAMDSVTDTGMDEPKALSRPDVEGIGAVGHAQFLRIGVERPSPANRRGPFW